MTTQTIALQDVRVFSSDHDGFVKILECERLRMIPTILGLRDVFAHEIRRKMASDTGRRDVMAGLLPGIVL